MDRSLKTHERTYHHGDLKNALVAAGLTILEEDGLPGLSLRAIAARVGVSHTAPKNHFGSLRGLLTAIGAEGFRRHAAFMREGLEEAATREDGLIGALKGYVRFAQAHPALFELMFSPLYCDHTDPELQARGIESYAVLREIARDLDWDKGTGAGAERRTEMMLWSFAHGYAKLRLADQFRPDEAGRVPPVEDVFPAFAYRAPD